MDRHLRRLLGESGYGEPGFAAFYDRFRPRPPRALLELLPSLLETDRLGLVVDLGSGTGLSTRVWADVADEVLGIEPNDAMRDFAEAAATPANVRYRSASSYETGIADASADLVTAAQSLQWMEPRRLFPEVGRILRRGGLFCAYNYVGSRRRSGNPRQPSRQHGNERTNCGASAASSALPRPHNPAKNCSLRAASFATLDSSQSTASRKAMVCACSASLSARGA